MANATTKGKSANILQHDFKAAFALKHLVKDLRLAHQTGLNTPLSTPLLESFQNALAAGMGEEDMMAIFKYLDKQGT